MGGPTSGWRSDGWVRDRGRGSGTVTTCSGGGGRGGGGGRVRGWRRGEGFDDEAAAADGCARLWGRPRGPPAVPTTLVAASGISSPTIYPLPPPSWEG